LNQKLLMGAALVGSGSALVLPIECIVAECRKRDVPVLVDGAHVPGAMPLDIEAIGADWDVTGEAMRQCELKAMSKLKQRARLLRWGEEAPKAAPAPAPAEQPKRGRGRAGRAA
jgi:hypothetical protein